MLSPHPSRFVLASLVITSTMAMAGCDAGRAPVDRIAARVTDAPSTALTLLGSDRAALESGAAKVGVLWHTEYPEGVENNVKEPTFVVQELVVSGSFPDAFTIELAESPPLDIVNSFVNGVLVVLDEDAAYGQPIRGYDKGYSGLFARLTESARAELGIVSIPPLYIFYSPDDGDDHYHSVFAKEHVFHENGLLESFDAKVAPGYHLALHDGVLVNESNLWTDCNDIFGRDDCGEYPYDRERRITWTVLNADDVLSVEVGGPNDLINTPYVLPETPGD